MEIRNNVVLTMSCRNRENAELMGNGLFNQFELNGSCRNTRTVINKEGDMVLSLRSRDPMKTVLDIAALLHRMGFREFDLAFRHKLTETWSIFHGAKGELDKHRPTLLGVDDGFAVCTKRNRKIRLLSRTTLSI